MAERDRTRRLLREAMDQPQARYDDAGRRIPWTPPKKRRKTPPAR